MRLVRADFLKSLIITAGVLFALLISSVCVGAGRTNRGQEKPKVNDQGTKETKTTVSGVVVNQKGIPLKNLALELYMVAEGVAQDAYGNPLKSAISIGPKRQILPLMMFPVKTETDATGRFSMEMPKYFLNPSGLRTIGWTIVNIDATGKVQMLMVNGEILTFLTKAEETKMDLGKLTLTAGAAERPGSGH